MTQVRVLPPKPLLEPDIIDRLERLTTPPLSESFDQMAWPLGCTASATR